MMAPRSEELTRQAAAAIGRDLNGYEWNDKSCCMLEKGWFPEGCEQGAFAPMTDPCDAYMVEATLQMNVRYEIKNGLMAIHFSTHRHKDLGYMTTTVINDIDAQTRARMYGATQFAAIVALAEDKL